MRESKLNNKNLGFPSWSCQFLYSLDQDNFIRLLTSCITDYMNDRTEF